MRNFLRKKRKLFPPKVLEKYHARCYTRQQIADMSGLRVETVIRTVKKMEKEGKLVLEGHKIVF